MSGNLPVLDRALELVHANEAFWAEIGQHETAKTPLGARLADFFRETWNPWYTRVMIISARRLLPADQATFARNIGTQLPAFRDLAAYRYALPVVDNGTQDDELAEIAGAPSRVDPAAREHHARVAAR